MSEYPKIITTKRHWTLGSLGRGGTETLHRVFSAEEETRIREAEARQAEQSKKDRETLVEQGYGDAVPFL